jgi:SAM-dependent methyltransferase
MHPVAEEGFGRSVEAYRRSRPSYPPEAVAWLVDNLRIGPSSVVVDLGAGTGKLTALLLPTGARVIAVEPLAQMRAALADGLPAVVVLDGRAEALPLPDASADAIVVGQAFHWFDLPRALPELRRVLRPSGRLGVIWNDLDVRVDWVSRFNDIIAVPRVGTPHPSEARDVDLADYFGTRQLAEFAHAHAHDRASVLERVASMSFVAVLPEDERERVFEQVAALIDSHPETAGRETFELPYLAEAWWAERRER